VVQRFYLERSFGFIRCLEGASDDIGQDFFFHRTGLVGCEMADLEEGGSVEFEPKYTPKGKRAEGIRVLP
jgi:cold shock CspA family protein